MDVNDIVAEKIEAARRKIANDKRRRQELAEARRHGLARRHAQKLARLARPKQPLTSSKEVSEETTVLPPPKGAADDSGPSGTPVMGETPTTPLTSQHPTRARGTGRGPNLLTHARETEIGEAQ